MTPSQEEPAHVHDAVRRIEMTAQVAGLGIWEYVPATDQVRCAGRAAAMTGLANGAATFDAFLQCVHASDRDGLRAAVEHAVNEPEQLFELRFRVVQGGHERVVSLAGRPYVGPDGPMLQAFMRDVTAEDGARRRLDDVSQRLQYQVDELTAALNVAPVGILVAHDADCTRMTANRMARTLLRIGPDENIAPLGEPGVERKRPYRLMRDGAPVPVEELPTVYAARHDVPLNGVECRVEWDNGEPPADILVYAEPLHGPGGEVRGCVTAFIDITARKQAESQLRELNDKLEHYVIVRTRSLEESRAQLRVMARELALAEEQERRRVANELHDYLAQMLVAAKMKLHTLSRQNTTSEGEDAARSVSTILEDALKYTRTLVAQLSPSMLLEQGIGPAARWLCDEFRARHGLQVSVEAGEEDLALDEQRLTFAFRALRELLVNASKYAPDAAIRVWLEREGGHVCIHVEDDGPGFDPADVRPDSPAEGGRFGLFSLSEMLRSVGGEFDIRSGPGEGVKALVRVPAQRSAEPAPAEDPVLPAADAPDSPARKCILIAGGDRAWRGGLTAAFEAYDDILIAGEAPSAAELLERTGEVRPQVVLVLAEDGPMRDAIAQLAADPAGPCVVALYDPDSLDREACLEAGAAAAMPVSAPIEELYCAVAENCDTAR